ncbi:MAG: amidohydrolase family protein [Acidimicrobiales bacterium]|jgi:predicted TIM-barrel fold metal-dependent hydrolase|nr:amidohydrolase family protein [Acidimicrobiales bacterium]
MTYLASPAVQSIRAQLDHPVIDTDGHVIEYMPWVRDLVVDIAGEDVAQRLDQMVGSAPLVRQVPGELRRQAGVTRSAWWALPSRNTLDRATAMLPGLLYNRLDQIGIDVALLYPTYGLTVTAFADDELRQAMARAFNIYMAEAHAEFSDRLIPVASIPMFTPEEAIAELDHAVGELGLKAVMLSGVIPRPIPGAENVRGARFINGVGHDSEYDYDPVWQRCQELGVCPTFHASAQGWGSRASRTNYVHNHIGNFAAAGEAGLRSLLLGGAPMRFPELRWAFLEGGVAWGANFLGDALGHYEKRNSEAIQHYNPASLDRDELRSLIESHGSDAVTQRLDGLDYALQMLSDGDEDDATVDEWAESGIRSADDIIGLFRDRFYFGCEADDPMNALAYQRHLVPAGVRLRAIFASDIGHWDVPDFTEVLPEAFELIEKELLDTDDFRDFVFDDPVRLFSAGNPDFFADTVVAEAAAAVTP